MLMLAQAPTLSLFAPVLVAAALAVTVLVLGRIVAKAKAERATQISERWVPSAVTSGDHPLNRVERRRRTTLTELLRSSELELDPADSGEITLRFTRSAT